MDYAYFNSVLAAESLPPADPWFSGGRLNYYYFGWMLVGVLAKLSRATPAVAYNLALASWFAMTATSAFSLAWNICAFSTRLSEKRRAWLAGSAALVAAVLLGNLDLPRALAPNLRAVAALGSGLPTTPETLFSALTERSERWLWAPSRTVGERLGTSQEINEFPAFSFLYGDLHPHLLAFPLQLLLLTALFGLIVRRFPVMPVSPVRSSWARSLGQIVAIAVALAALRASNSWDWPLYLGLSCLVCLVGTWDFSAEVRLPGVALHGRRWVIAGLVFLLLVGLQSLVALPFSSYFVTGPLHIHLFTGKPTALSAWCAIQGWFLIAIVAWCWQLSRDTSVVSTCLPTAVEAILRIILSSGLIYTGLVSGAILYTRSGEIPAIGVQVALLAWIAILLGRFVNERRRAIGLAMALAGFGLALMVEIVVVGDDIGRMNTFFKFHLQSWVLLSISSGLALSDLLNGRLRNLSGRIFVALFVPSTVIAMAYLPLATYGRMHTRFNSTLPLTLDGEAFLAHAVYEINGVRIDLADDYKMIRWLREHAASDDVLLEAHLPEYRWGSRMSVFTGRPTLLGYRHHQSQQRPLPALREAIELRQQNIRAIYESANAIQTAKMLRHYGVRFVIVGGVERATYSPRGLATLESLAQDGRIAVVFRSGNDVIYRLARENNPVTIYGANW